MTVISPHAERFARNINKELAMLPGLKNLTVQQRQNMFWKNALNRIQKKNMGAYFRCPECQKYLVGDNVVLQLHMQKEHIKDRKQNLEKPFRFHPERTGRNERVV